MTTYALTVKSGISPKLPGLRVEFASPEDAAWTIENLEVIPELFFELKPIELAAEAAA
jgi:hypothetical protein